MKKCKSLNSKGFVLVETLVVTVFVVVILSIMYNNFYPLMSEYEKREYYDDIDSKYATYWIKRFVQDGDYMDYNGTESNFQRLLNGTVPYLQFECSHFSVDAKKILCNQFIRDAEIAMNGTHPKIYITAYRIGHTSETVKREGDTPLDVWKGVEVESDVNDFKKMLTTSTDQNSFDTAFRDYVNYLPDYQTESINEADFRVIVQFERTPPSGADDSEHYFTFATFEVKK